jgi:aldose 1-epimerase
MRGYGVDQADRDGFAAVVLHDHAADLHATFVPEAGAIGASLLHGGEELLGQGRGLAQYVESGHTMGIPFLHPWANRLSSFEYDVEGRHVRLDPSSPLVHLDEHGLPIHGLLGASPWWSVVDQSAGEDAAALVAELDFAAHADLFAAFPFPHRVRMEVTLRDAGLTIRTTIAPTGAEPVPVAFGFHPYLRLPGLPREQWQVRLPVLRRMLLDDRMIPSGESEDVAPFEGPVGDRSWDDAYDRLERPARFELRGGGRTIALEFVDGYGYAQVFSPPGGEFICFEPMTAPANALHLPPGSLEEVPPGEKRSATFRIEVYEAR